MQEICRQGLSQRVYMQLVTAIICLLYILRVAIWKHVHPDEVTCVFSTVHNKSVTVWYIIIIISTMQYCIILVKFMFHVSK